MIFVGYNFKLTVQDVLKRPLFEHAEVIAGAGGIYRIVDWVHVAEVSRIEHLLNGNELILSTGVGWGGTKEKALSFLNQLIGRNAAGLCVELGMYLSEIPAEMIQLANETRFPLIVFTEEVRFVDITQDLHTVLHDMQKKQIDEDRWLHKWLSGQCDGQEIAHRLQALEVPPDAEGIAASLSRVSQKTQALEASLTEITMIARSVLRRHGFFLLSSIKDAYFVFILIDQDERGGWKRRLSKGLERLQELVGPDHPAFPHIPHCIGKRCGALTQLDESFRTALETLHIRERIGKDAPSFFDDLHIYRMIYSLDQTGHLQKFVTDYLAPIIEYDRSRQGDMLLTLKTFLACNGSKQETATRLFIVRQTLYHRLKKLEELLGSDFMRPEKRLAIEVALAAHDYLQAGPKDD